MNQQKTAYLMIAPAIIVLLLLIAYPFFLSLYMSFTDKRIGEAGKFIGFQNYIYLFQSGIFWQVLKNTSYYTFFAVLLKAILGILLALILKQITFGRRVIRAFILLPWVVPATLSVLGWWWMFHPTASIVNWMVGFKIPWLYNPFWARAAVITVNTWRGIPFFTICFLAGLVSIPEELYEAASVDGAGKLKRFFHITLPMLKPILGIVILFSIVRTVSDFVIVHVLTRGGPLQATHLFGTLAYQIGLSGTEIGKGAAISLFIFPFLAISAFILLRIVRRGAEFG